MMIDHKADAQRLADEVRRLQLDNQRLREERDEARGKLARLESVFNNTKDKRHDT